VSLEATLALLAIAGPRDFKKVTPGMDDREVDQARFLMRGCFLLG
jgi:hypothetical protein